MKVVAISVTDAGRHMAERLPYERVHGQAGDTVRRLWAEADAFVLFLATGAAVRIIGPLLDDKTTDPAVVCVDEAGRFAVALSGGHAGGANDLARDVAALLGAEPVITTATDRAGIAAFDVRAGVVAEGDVAGATTAMLDGRPTDVVVSDELVVAAPGRVALRPATLVLGVGCSTGATAAEVATLVEVALAEAGLARASVTEVATIDRRLDHPAVTGLGLRLRTFTAEALAEVEVPNPSRAVADAVGTPSVCEAAALLAAGEGAHLVVTKRSSSTATVAVARRAQPRGHLSLVGLGPGGPLLRTPAAAIAVRNAEVVIGYSPYVDQCADLLSSAQEVVRSPIGDEVVRAKQCLADAAAGRRVAMVCSGDAGVYAMASIVLELAGELAPDIEIEVVPGVTAALAAAAVLGAPLGHDHAAISLSDLLTPWEAIERRLRAVAEADLVVSLYNPRSRGRDWQLPRAVELLAERRLPTTPVGIVTCAGRTDQKVIITTLAELDPTAVGMTTCVIIGSSTTRLVNGRMVTPRGYEMPRSARSRP
jgi:cobalt-precorrin 5A hydrolase/precorrin-3B C17-methyltransferase